MFLLTDLPWMEVLLGSSGTAGASSPQSGRFGVHAAWKRSQVGSISGRRSGIMRGFGWPDGPDDSVSCSWLV